MSPVLCRFDRMKHDIALIRESTESNMQKQTAAQLTDLKANASRGSAQLP